MRIVEKGLKCDFHIHSVYSKHKETGDLTSNNTINNLDELVNQLYSNEVEMAAITDHDVFSYEMYTNFCSKANKLKLILPGVEFSMAMKDSDGNLKQIHVITLFNNNDVEKIKKIEEVLTNGKDDKGNDKKPPYDALNGTAYTQDKIIKMLDEIGLDVVMIAHQKKSMLSKQSPAKNDFNTLDSDEQNYLLFTEYFQALEFHDKKNELFNIKKKTDFKDDILHFITGSDCHEWSVYPSHDSLKHDGDNYRWTYLKCLPTFRGVSLALTEDSRIKLENSFFSVSPKYQEEIKLNIQGNEFVIPLSKGINAIIGDNSIGKSLLIHKMTNYYRKDVDKDTSAIGDEKIVKKYEEYLKSNGIEVITKVDKAKIYEFDSQGEIRKKFSQNKLNKNLFISKRKKDNPSIAACKKQVEDYVKKYIIDLKLMVNKNALEKELNSMTVSIPKDDLEAKVLKGVNYETTSLDTNKTNKTEEINKFDGVINSINEIKQYLNSEELEKVNEFSTYMQTLLEIRKKSLKEISNCISVIEHINSVLTTFNSNQTTTDDDKVIKQFNTQKNNLISTIISCLEKKNQTIDFTNPTLGKVITVPSEKYTCGKLKIVTCASVKTINDEYLKKLFIKPLNKDKFKKETFLSDESLAAAISRHDPNLDPWEEYIQLIQKIINDDFKEVIKLNYITESDDMDHSSGLNDKMYFEILSNDDGNEGIYFIDQPEDDISQKAIRDNLISCLRKMGNNRQIILITHNPQFVVNLDVDNVIYLYKNQDNNIGIHSGALEYQDETIDEDILKDVAETLDGGVITIRKRWKKYEKNVEDIFR